MILGAAMKEWTEIKISVNAADIDRAGDIANVVVPCGIYIEDYTNLEQIVEDIAHIDLIDEDLLAKDRSRAFVHVYLEPDVSPAEAVAFLSERYEPHERHTDLAVVPREKPHTGAAAREQPRDSPVIER